MKKCLILNNNARWIWAKAEEINQYVDFRSEFYIHNTDRVRLIISVDSRYAVFVNGEYVPGFQYADYPNYKVYDELDITDRVNIGKNVLSIVGYYQGESSSVYYKGRAGLIFAVIDGDGNAVAVSDRRVLCRPSGEYTSGAVEKLSIQLSYSFRYDANGDDGWRELGYLPSSDWSSAAETGYECELFPRPIRQLRFEEVCRTRLLLWGAFKDSLPKSSPCGDRMQTAFLSFGGRPSTQLPKSDGYSLESEDQGDGIYFIIDIGREESGVFELEIDLPHQAEILVGFGEHLDDLRVRTSVGGRQFAAVYTARAGRQRFTHYFKRMGCRYISVYAYARQIRLYYVGLHPTPYPFEYKKVSELKDALHRKISETSIRTLELCAHEHYEDCPWREQALYAMDSRNQMLFGYTCFDNPELPRESLRLLALGQKENGLLELCAPAESSITIPAFSLVFVTAVKEYLENVGDGDFVKELLPAIGKILDFFRIRIDKSGLIPFIGDSGIWNFYEWSNDLDGSPAKKGHLIKYEAPINAFMAMALSDAQQIYKELGIFDKAEQCKKEYEGIATALENFWDEERGLYASYITENGFLNYAELTQYLIICSGAVGKERAIKISDLCVKKEGNLVPITLGSALFEFQALMRFKERYKDFLESEIEEKWAGMLLKGATSFWETLDGADAFGYAGSLCHGWSAAPVWYFNSGGKE